MNLFLEQAEFLKDVCKLITYAFDKGFVVTGGELYRTIEQQKLYVKRGLSKTMDSNHLKRCAIDLNFFINEKLTYKKEDLFEVGLYWESLHPKNRWGGNFTNLVDTPHFERNI